MSKSKHFIFAVMAAAITLLIFGSRAASAQATNTGILNATPTPTNTPTEGSGMPGEPPSEEEQEEIKAVVQEYVDIRYRALSVSDAEDFTQNRFGDLILAGPVSEAFLREEMAKLAVEMNRAEVYHLRYVSYNYSLNFDSITFDPRSQTAIVSMMESNEVVYETSAELAPDMPIVSHSAGIGHTVLLQKAQGQWKIVSDTYNDDLWRMLRHGDAQPSAEQPVAMLRRDGESTDAILGMAEEMMRVLDLAPKSSPAEKAPVTRQSISTFDAMSSGSSHPYDRDGAVQYAFDHWNRDLGLYNPNYPPYSGTDCQNFVSQALYEGGNVSMYIPNINAPPTTDGQAGWYSFDEMRRASAWNDVDAFYSTSTYAFIDEGPAGELLGPPLRPEVVGTDLVNDWPAGLEPGDVIQYEWLQTETHQDSNGPAYDHSAIVVAIANGIPYIAAHTIDHDMVPYYLLTPIEEVRFIKIKYSHGNPPVKAEMNWLSNPADDAGGNPASPCLNTNWDSGNNYLGSCLNGGDITSGFLFRGVEIPKGAQIKYAYITFTTDGTYVVENPLGSEVLAPISLRIYGENSDAPLDFSPTNTPPGQRTNLTTSSVPWPIDGTNGIPYDTWSLTGKRTTPDLTDIIQSIVGLPGWDYGDPLSMIFKNALSGSGDIRSRRVLAIERISNNSNYWSARLIAAYTINDDPTTTPPRVYSVTRESASPTNDTAVNFIVQFTEAVTGVDMYDFTLPLTDEPVVEASITSVTPDPVDASLYTIHVNTDTGDGTIKIDVKNSGTNIKDLQDNALNGGFSTGESYTIDKTAPTPVSIALTSPNPTNSASVDFIVTFSEYVTEPDISDFDLIDLGISGASITSVNFLTSRSYTVSVNTGSGEGTLGLVLLPNRTITDSASNPLYLIVPFLSSGSYTIDKVTPTTSSSVLASSNPTSSSIVDFTITFPEPVSGVDITDFTLTTTGVFGAAINSISGSGSEYTVTVDTGNMDGTIRLDIPANASITDIIGNPLTGLPYTNGEAYTVTKAIVPFEGDEFNGPELVAGWQWYVPNPGPTYSLSAVPGSLRMSLPTGGYFEHWGTDDYAPQLRHIGLDNTDWAIETRLEGINAAADAGYLAAMEVGFDQYDQIWFGVAYDGNLHEIRTAECCSSTALSTDVPILLRVEKLGATYTFLYKHDTDIEWTEFATKNYVGTPVYIGLIGRSWNTGSSDLEFDWSYFHIEPWFAPLTVSSITRNDVNPTNAGTVDFTIIFSETVTGVDINDFALATGGLSGAAITNVSGLGNTYTVTAQTGSGEGTLRLDVLDNDTIINSASRPLEGGFTNGETYTVDRTAPSAISIVRASFDPTNEASVEFTIDFSENVTGVDLSDFTLTTNDVSGATLSDISGVDGTYTIIVNTGAGSGTIRLDVADNDTIVDTIGNPLGGVGIGNGNFMSGEVYTVDKNILLTVTSVAAQDGYVLESTETSSVGGSVNTAATTFFVGDHAQDRQYLSLLSFGTSGLPDNAVIVSATLKLKLQSVVGTNPFTTHNNLVADIRQPYFGAGVALQIDDFAATAGAVSVGTVGSTPLNGYYIATLNTTGLTNISKTGSTQLRLRFQLDDNDDLGADYLALYSANATTSTDRPILEIVYYIP